MVQSVQQRLAECIESSEKRILKGWVQELEKIRTRRSSPVDVQELTSQCQGFLSVFCQAVRQGSLSDTNSPEWVETRSFLDELSSKREQQGFTSSETARFVFSLKQPGFALIRETFSDLQEQPEAVWTWSLLLDNLGLYTVEAYQKVREHVIRRQQQEILELSTPVIKLWDGVLAVPLIGTLDSARTQVVMETLLQRIVETGSEIAVIDITGVPTVDTLVAQHLL